MKIEEKSMKQGEFSVKDYISPSYVNTKNPKYIEIDRYVFGRDYACRL